MTFADDYLDEMFGRNRIDDATTEDLFAGRPVPADLEPLATVVRALRDVSNQPVPASTELAARIAAGSAAADPVRSGTARGWLPGTAQRAVTGLVAATHRSRWAAKLAAVAAGLAVAGVGSAGFAGSLPPPVQDRFETAVESITPYQFPQRATDPATGGAGRGERGGGQAPGAGPAGRISGNGQADPRPGAGHGPAAGNGPAAGSGPGAGPGAPGEHGGQVSQDARDRGVDGDPAGSGARKRGGGIGQPPAGPPPGQQHRPAGPAVP